MPNFNFEFDEHFFTRVVERAGGFRLKSKFTPPEGAANVDYLIADYFLELKHLETEPLQAPSAQAAYLELCRQLRIKYPGDFTRTPSTGQVNVTGEAMNHIWKFRFGNTIRKAMRKAAMQIAGTRAFTGQNLRGALLAVNLTDTIDGYSLVALLQEYQPEFPEIDVCFGFNAVLHKIVGAPANARALSFGSTARKDHQRDDALHQKLHDTIQTEIASRGFPSVPIAERNLVLVSEKEKIEIPHENGPIILRPQPIKMDPKAPPQHG